MPMADAAAHATLVLAVVTGVLAAATVALAFISYCGIRSARAGADRQIAATRDAAAREVAAAREQLDASYRPILVPFQRSADNVTFRGGQIPTGGGPHVTGNPPERKDLPRYSAAFLPVVNVGTGPALNVRGSFAGPRGAGTTRFATEAIALRERGVVVFENWTGESLEYTGNDSSVSAIVEYDDVAGRTYRTRVVFDVGNNAYESKLEVGDLSRTNDSPGGSEL